MQRAVLRPGSAGEHELQEQFDTVDRAERFYTNQVLDHLNDRMLEFLSRQEMMFVATSDKHGECDATFRAGDPGFVHAIDARTVMWPEFRGNGVMASLGNITENGHVGLLFVDFFQDVIGLHVNGAARIVEHEIVAAAHPALVPDGPPGRRPQRWVEVAIDEAYIHCSKNIPQLAKVPRGSPQSVKRNGADYFVATATSSVWKALPRQLDHGAECRDACCVPAE